MMPSSSITACVPSIPSMFPPNPLPTSSPRSLSLAPRRPPAILCGIRELRERIHSVKSTQKITEAMKLVAAARVRRAQDAVINSRPFAEKLLDFLCYINEQVRSDDVEVPLTVSRPVRSVAIVVVTGDRGLCGGFNNAVTKKAESRVAELTGAGIDCRVISVGKKGNAYFRRRPSVKVDRFIDGGGFPTAKEAQIIADEVFSRFVCEEVDKVELVYTKFVSLVKSDPVIHTLLPLSSKGEVLDMNGNCVDADGDEFFRLTSKDGKLAVERQRFGKSGGGGIPPLLTFEQDPVQILDAMMPLYLNSQILRALQESIASELAARMNAMSSATDNAVELKKNLSTAYNRERQAKITGEILEIVAGAEALVDFD
ncbi:hypothetical protein MLD38_000701 [Melastoma candidum]|uniref:Uncharacterized protein n=1 Tax=Melastoma candidum TaxID=119954 RepID=A0ACB9SC73_9MYRT|nr:hypothetical protein MLD38_000701 [Melastoma candidum]